MRNGGTLAGLADDDVVEVPARVGRDGPVPLEQRAARAGAARARPARRRLRAAGRRGGGHARRGDCPQGAARAPADRPARDRPAALFERPLLARSRCDERRSSSPSTAATRRPTSRWCATTARVLALVRGAACSSPHHIGLDGCVELLQALLDEAGAQAGLDGDAGRRRRRCCWPALDFPPRSARCTTRSPRAGWARGSTVGNDTFAVLRAGTERGWGVAVVCGAGINCVGVGARRPPRALPGARRDQRRLGRRLRRRPRGARAPPPAARTAAARARGSSRRCPRTSASARRASWPRRSTSARSPLRRLVELRRSCSRGRRPTRWRPGSSTGWRPRWSCWPRWRCGGWSSTATPVEVLLGGGMFQRGGRRAGGRDPRRARRRRSTLAAPRRRRSSAPRCSGSTSSGWTARRRSACGASWRAGDSPEREADLWLRCGSSRRRASTRAATRPRSTRSTWRSATAS